MSPDEIKRYLVENSYLHNPKLTLLGGGESNRNYLAEDDTQKLVVRVARNDVPEYFRFETERHYMLFIEALGIEFAPRTIHCDPQRNIHLVSYVAGKDASILDLTDSQTDVFIDQLKRLNQITYEEYTSWCDKTGQAQQKPLTLDNRNRLYMQRKLQAIRDNTPSSAFAREIIAWALPKVEVLHAAARELEPRLVFLHDDLRWNEHGGNLKIMHDRIVFIDWELAGFLDRGVLEVGDVLGSIPYADKNVMKRLYNKYVAHEPNSEQINTSIKYGVLWGRLGNTLWAAERYFFLTKTDHPDVGRYRRLAERGMRDAEPFFDAPFENWFQ